MAIQTTYTNARSQFDHYFHKAVDNREVVIIKRKGTEDAALISAAELTGLLETCHLLRSPRNAERLMSAFERAMKKDGKPGLVDDLKKEAGFE